MEQAVKFVDAHMGLVGSKLPGAYPEAPQRSRQSANGSRSALGHGTPSALEYKAKMKGVALAFNVHEPAAAPQGSNYKFRINQKLTADEVKMRVYESKQKKIAEKQVKEAEEKAKYQRDRESLRKMHEKLRKEKLN